MSSFFDRISSSFSTNSSKKLFYEILESKYILQAKYEPSQLKRILSDKQGKQVFMREMSLPQSPLGSSPCSQLVKETHLNVSLFRTLKKLSMFHHLVIYYHEFAQLIQVIDVDCMIESITGCWFVDNVIKPYANFVKRYCLSIQVYQKLKAMPYGSKQAIFQCMCYAINVSKTLFAVVSKLSSIGRYYRQKYPRTVDYFVQLMAYHSQLIYQGFRSCISEIISFSKEHLSQKQDEIIFKDILHHDLPWINEEMKKLFLDKYFYPYGKGYGVKLYRFEDQSECQLQIINGILNDHQRTERETQTRMFEETLFPTHLVSKYSHEDLQKSFSFSLSKLQHLRRQNKQISNPQKDSDHNFNNSLPNIKLGFQKRGSENPANSKKVNITSLQKINFEEEVVDDIDI